MLCLYHSTVTIHLQWTNNPQVKYTHKLSPYHLLLTVTGFEETQSWIGVFYNAINCLVNTEMPDGFPVEYLNVHLFDFHVL